MVRALCDVFAAWVREELDSWRRWLRWRQEDRPLLRREREVKADYRRRLDELRPFDELNPPPEVTHLLDERRRAIEDLQKERQLAETEYLRFQAERFYVELPQDHSEQMGEHGWKTDHGWYPEPVKGRGCLTDRGVTELRGSISAERRRRREGLVACVGLIGALTGLIAVTAAFYAREPIVVVTATTSTSTEMTSTTSLPTTTTARVTTTTVPEGPATDAKG